MDDLSISEEKLKAILMYRYMYIFSELEKTVKKYFEDKLSELDIKDTNKLYFYSGGLVCKNLFIDFNKEMFCLNNYKYNKKCFEGFTINQIMNLANTNSIGDMFDIQVDSLQWRHKYEVKDSITKLIKMRNKFAHELPSLEFKYIDCIELLSMDNLMAFGGDMIYDFDIKDDYTQVKFIFSNIIYMEKIRDKLCSLLEHKDDSRVKSDENS